APTTGPAAVPSARIVVTYHQALLDTVSAHLLLGQFYRAYLADGLLPGGERRPDLRDYTAWLTAQDPGPARALFTAHPPPPAPPALPRPAGVLPATGTGRHHLNLSADDTARLARWAAAWGTTESSALNAVWALLLYRAGGGSGPRPVTFAVTVPGRGIRLDGAAALPGPLRNPLPVSVLLDPRTTVPHLLRRLRDSALDLAAYEWLPADWIPTWNPATPAAATEAPAAATVVVFEDPPHPLHGLARTLAAHGLDAGFPAAVPASPGQPLALLARHDSGGGLRLDTVWERALVDDRTARLLLEDTALLLRTLPRLADETTTLAQVLHQLPDRTPPRPRPRSRRGAGPAGAAASGRPRAGRDHRAGSPAGHPGRLLRPARPHLPRRGGTARADGAHHHRRRRCAGRAGGPGHRPAAAGRVHRRRNPRLPPGRPPCRTRHARAAGGPGGRGHRRPPAHPPPGRRAGSRRPAHPRTHQLT
ncbi:hypothetical protein KBY47_36120, partial [Streptomyces sp. B93]